MGNDHESFCISGGGSDPLVDCNLPEDGSQTRRMAAAILANAFMFHEILAGGQDELADINSLEQLRG